jgi:hypothetical protein
MRHGRYRRVLPRCGSVCGADDHHPESQGLWAIAAHQRNQNGLCAWQRPSFSARPRRCWRRRGLCQGHAHGRPRWPGLCDTRLDLSGIGQGFYRTCARLYRPQGHCRGRGGLRGPNLFALRREFFCELARRKKWEREAAKSRQEWSFAGGQVNCRFRPKADIRLTILDDGSFAGLSEGAPGRFNCNGLSRTARNIATSGARI